MATGRCDDCGYLAVRDRGTRELFEVDGGARKTWALPMLPGNQFDKYEVAPICFVQAADLEDECGNDRSKVLPVIQSDRRCERFVDWKQGYSPRERADMVYAEEVRRRADGQKEQDRAWYEKLRAEQNAFLATEQVKNHEWQERQQRANRRMQLASIIAWVVVALIGIYFGVSVG